MAGEFAVPFNSRQWAEMAGWYHDLGKYSQKFQRRLGGSGERVDHSTAGARHVVKAWGEKLQSSRLLAYVIAGHHAGLPNYGSVADSNESCLAIRLNRVPEPYETEEIKALPAAAPLAFSLRPGLEPGFQLALFTRMVFSCLVDADSLDTEAFVNPKKSKIREHNVSFKDLLDRFRMHNHANFSETKREIDRRRAEILQECLAQAEDDPGLYTLTLPTGAGKTLTSLGFALKHAVKNELKRIIYVIPYTSIIEQNAQKLREVLGDPNVLEHHSNVRHAVKDEEDEEYDVPNAAKKLELAEENWDVPVIVTTNVQFFESLFANKRARCQKMHNIAGSVIVLDEAQMINGGFFRPILYALEELVRNYGCTVVFCTATQPELAKLLPKPVPIREIVEDVPLRFEQFGRVKLQRLGIAGYDEIAARLADHQQALCIVNTRRAARELFEKAVARCGAGRVWHLSARMCPNHRLAILGKIRKQLEDNQPCILISTQLIEAGVDIDFPVVYRELAGLDSIAQAAGRCNREAKAPFGHTYVFEPEAGLPKGWFTLTASVTRAVLDKYPDDPLSLAAVRDYFNELLVYQTMDQGKDTLDEKGILPLTREGASRFEFPFRDIASRFQLIDTTAKPVIVPWRTDEEKKDPFKRPESQRLLEALRSASGLKTIMRDLQPYIVQLYPQEFEDFRQANELEEVREGIWALSRPELWYDDNIGIRPFSAERQAEENLVL